MVSAFTIDASAPNDWIKETIRSSNTCPPTPPMGAASGQAASGFKMVAVMHSKSVAVNTMTTRNHAWGKPSFRMRLTPQAKRLMAGNHATKPKACMATSAVMVPGRPSQL